MGAGAGMGLLGSLASGVLGLGSSALNAGSQRSTNRMMQRENEKNRQFSHDEAQLQRNWQSEEWQLQYDQQRDEWYNQQEYQHAYDAPTAQVARMRAAGMNPSVQGDSGGLVPASSANVSAAPPTGGSVSGAAASAPSTPNYQAPKFDLSPLADLGNFLSSTAEARKTDATLDGTVRLLEQRVLGEQLTNSMNDIELAIKKGTKDVSIQKAWEELRSTILENNIKSLTGENISMDTLLKQSEKLLADAKTKLSSKEYEKLALELSYLPKMLQSQIDVNKSKVNANNAVASYTGALAATENQLREFKVEHQKLLNSYQTFENSIKQNDAWIKDKTYTDELAAISQKFLEEAKREHILTQQAEEALERAIKDNRWYEVRAIILPMISQLSENIYKGANLVKGALD